MQPLQEIRNEHPGIKAFIKYLIMTLLSNKIREYRFRNGEMTQKALAERVGVSRQTMNAIENARHAPTIVVAIRIADVFHVSVDQLFDLEYPDRPVRRGQAPSVAIDRSQAPIEESIRIEINYEQPDKEATRETGLAELRGVI